MKFTILSADNHDVIEAASRREARELARSMVNGPVFTVAENVADCDSAWEAFDAALADEEYKDNYRHAFDDDAAGYAKYEELADKGCCGSADLPYRIGNRTYWIGCNYGH